MITINDISADAFYQLLHYLYCGQLHALTLTTATTIELLFAGNKYLLPSLAYKVWYCCLPRWQGNRKASSTWLMAHGGI